MINILDNILYEIKVIVLDFFKFLNKPKEFFTEPLSVKQKWKIIFSLLLLDFVLVFISSVIISLIDEFLFELNTDSYEAIFSNKGIGTILFLVVIIVPFIEELIFRFPLKYERNLLFQFFNKLTKNRVKLFWDKYFRFFFYISALLFATTHSSNYGNNNKLFYLLIPIIVLPQFIGGMTLGYIRLKLGFFWGVLEHSLYNFIIFSIMMLFFNSSNLVSVNNSEYTLVIDKLEFGLNNPSELKRHQSEQVIDSIIATNYPVKFLAENLNSQDSLLLKSTSRINLRFVNKSNVSNPTTIILTELKKELK